SEKVFTGQDSILVPSPKEVDGYYDRKPEMSAYEVTDKLLAAIESDKYDVIVLNFANMDMVGHTGVIPAAIKAVETVDLCIGKVVSAIQKKNGLVIVTADHGNADHMIEQDGSVMTAHSMNKVPMVVISNEQMSLKKEGKLADIVPTLLDILKIEKPIEMTGESLLL
ncbi:MAG: alkaline phosphatase family protein, partial [Candidatus Riflemargulisbacteria bacterium]